MRNSEVGCFGQSRMRGGVAYDGRQAHVQVVEWTRNQRRFFAGRRGTAVVVSGRGKGL